MCLPSEPVILMSCHSCGHLASLARTLQGVAQINCLGFAALYDDDAVLSNIFKKCNPNTVCLFLSSSPYSFLEFFLLSCSSCDCRRRRPKKPPDSRLHMLVTCRNNYRFNCFLFSFICFFLFCFLLQDDGMPVRVHNYNIPQLRHIM